MRTRGHERPRGLTAANFPLPAFGAALGVGKRSKGLDAPCCAATLQRQLFGAAHQATALKRAVAPTPNPSRKGGRGILGGCFHAIGDARR